MQYVVTTQVLENYGAHDTDGKFKSGNAYWKFKFGSEYLVNDVERPADAMAFIMAAYGANTIGWKEFPTDVVTYQEWLGEVDQLDEDYAAFKKETLHEVSPIHGSVL